jgi:hypothetical protein
VVNSLLKNSALGLTHLMLNFRKSLPSDVILLCGGEAGFWPNGRRRDAQERRLYPRYALAPTKPLPTTAPYEQFTANGY